MKKYIYFSYWYDQAKKLASGLFYRQVIFSQQDVILSLAFTSGRPIFQESEGIV